MKYEVQIKNFVTKKYDTLKLTYDPRTGKEGLAIYETINEAEFCRNIARILGNVITLRIKKIEND